MKRFVKCFFLYIDAFVHAARLKPFSGVGGIKPLPALITAFRARQKPFIRAFFDGQKRLNVNEAV
jgi:hypothetical protein